MSSDRLYFCPRKQKTWKALMSRTIKDARLQSGLRNMSHRIVTVIIAWTMHCARWERGTRRHSLWVKQLAEFSKPGSRCVQSQFVKFSKEHFGQACFNSSAMSLQWNGQMSDDFLAWMGVPSWAGWLLARWCCSSSNAFVPGLNICGWLALQPGW